MENETYFVITSSEDGINIETLSKHDIEKRITEHYYGDDALLLDKLPLIDGGFFSIPGKGDRTPVLIVRGEIVVPKPVEKITRYVL